MLGLIGKKIGMTRVRIGKKIIPCTVVQSNGCIVTQIKGSEKNGYNAVQLGYDERKEKNTPKPLVRHFAKANTTPKKEVQEFRNFLADYGDKKLALGDSLGLADIFEEDEFIDVQAFSKGKGFQGVVKRHSFKGEGDRTHGQHNRERAPGAIGNASNASRVFKGMRMAGQTGHEKTTVKNLKVLKLIADQGLIILQGPIPGPRHGYVTLKK